MSAKEAPDLAPEVEVACVVCGGDATETICDEGEVKSQLAWLERFHRRRLRARGRSADEALSDRSAFTQDYATAIVRCVACGLVFRESRPSDATVTEAYEEDTYGEERLAALHEAQLELFRAKAGRVQRLLGLRADARIVEIGSFVGGFLGAARERGWSAVGVDPGEEVAAFCREKGFVVHRETAPEAPIEDASVDAVTVWNTFDQLPDPRPTLAAVRRWLRPGGGLALRVPSGACFRSAIATLRRTPAPLRRPLLAALAWNNLLAFPYLHGHSTATLDRLLAPFGFERIAVDPDTLARLADEETKRWAVWEERLLKSAWRGLARAGAGPPPWLDVYFRRRE